MGFQLELRLKQATHLKNVLEALSDIFREANFDFSGTRCEIQTFDTSGVALLSLRLPEDAFAPKSCFRDISMGLNLADIAEAFRSVNDNDEVIIKAERDKIIITFESENGVISHFHFDVDINVVPHQIQDPSESEYQAIVRLPSALFMFICRKLSSFVDCQDRDTVVIITVDKKREGVSFFAWGEKKTSRIVYPPEPTQIEMKEKVSLMFALRYIKSFSKVSTLSDQVTISLSSKKAAVFKCEIAGMGNVRYCISPVDEIQNEGDEEQRLTRYYKSLVPVDEDEMQND